MRTAWPPAVVLAALGALGLGLPRPAEATRTPGPTLGAGPPAEVGRTGGVVHLRQPRSDRILIPESTFTMGSTPDDVVYALTLCMAEPRGHRCEEKMFSDELPRHEVTLSAYWLDRTEVTVREYRRCVALRRCRPIPFAQGGKRFDRPRYPVSLVRWRDARDYCAFRGARLPTEAEFERAAKGPTGRRFPWGDLYNAHASNHGRFSFATTDRNDGFSHLAPVGSFPSGSTPGGFLDLAGNVSEWVVDRYTPSYDKEPASNPKGPGTGRAGQARSVRGGGFTSAAPWLRGAARNGAQPNARRPDLGFRCARSAGGTELR